MRFAFLALLTGLLSCQTATQITVELRGIGVSCPSGESPTIEQTGLLAKPELQSRDTLPKLAVVGEQCEPTGDGVVALGNIVLVPAEGPGPVEVLAVGALAIGDTPAVSAEDCRAEYERLFGSPCEIGEGHACESCIFARRSVAFVKHSKLSIGIDLDATCAGVICDPSQTCSKGTCVSAEASCAEDGSCTLVHENEGGAGGGGGGGGAPAGGQGGEGGTPDPGVWATLWDPSEPACGAGTPSDVIGAMIDSGNGNGPHFHALVAAGVCMLVLEDGEAPLAVADSVTRSENAYRAVARASATGDFVSLGDFGYARFAQDPPFSTINPQLASFTADTTSVAWDIAPYDGVDSLAWTRTYQGGTGPSGEIVPFVSGEQDSIFRAALFAVFPNAAPAQPVTFAAWDTTVVSRRAGITKVATTPTTDGGWALWGAEILGNPGEIQAVAIGGSTDAVYAGRCSDTSIGPDPNCDFVAAPLTLVPSSVSRLKVLAVWGIQASDGVQIYAVGEAASGPWLGRASLPDPGDLSASLDWAFAPLPPQMQAVASVWVGQTDAATDGVVVVGPAGVFKADLDELDFLFLRP